MIDDRLAMTITHSDGSVDRWGPDEPDGHDIPADLQFTTSIPGGFKDMSCTLQRDLILYSDEQLLDNVLIYGIGNDPIWEGRMAAFPRGSDQVTPTAVGWISHLQDDTTACEIYVDRDFNQWGGPSVQRITAMQASAADADGGSVVVDVTTGNPSVVMGLTDAWARYHSNEMWYGKNIPIDSIYYAWKKGGSIDNTDTHWHWFVGTSSDDLASSYDVTSDLRAAGPSTGTRSATTSSRLWGFIQLYYDTLGGAAGAVYNVYFTCLAVYGRHGLTKRGTADATNAQGFFVSDIVSDIVKRWGPLLNYTYPGSIEQTGFVVPHFAQYSASTGFDMLALANGFELKDWGVYSGGEEGWPSRTFFLREPSADRLTWRARISDGHVLTSEGVQAEDLVNGVIVNFRTPDGTSFTAGPPGSGANYTSTTLQDTDPTNPVNAHGIPRKYGGIDVTKVTTPAGATQLGAIWLSRRLGIQKRGTLSIVGKVKHPNGTYYPAARVRSGDYVIVEDDPRDTDPRKIVNTNYVHATRTNECDLEHEAFRIDALMERWGTVVGALESS